MRGQGSLASTEQSQFRKLEETLSMKEKTLLPCTARPLVTTVRTLANLSQMVPANMCGHGHGAQKIRLISDYRFPVQRGI